MIFRNLIFLLIIFLCGCEQKDRVYQYKDYIFGTIIDIKIYGETENKSKQITNLIFDDFQRLHNYLHPWEKSLISDMNHAISTGKSFTIDDAEIIRVLKENTELSQKTDNFFNPAMGKLIALWGFHEDNIKQSIPSSSVIKDFVSNMPLMEDLTITNNTVSSKNKKFQLDLGGYAKGYALDRAKIILQNNNIKNALVNIGGNIIAIGMRGDRNWIVGIQHPRKPSAIASINLLPGWSIGTSGDYQRYFMMNEKRYSHLINPISGFPSANSQSTTILIPPSKNSGVLSDVYSKPLFIAPTEMKIEIAKKLNIKYFMIIQNDEKILISNEMNKVIKWIDLKDEKDITVY